MLQEIISNYWWQLLILTITSYLIGNFCAAIFVSKKFIKQDIRQHGSKNPGTTNMTRVFGIKFGIITLFIDLFKALICVLAGKLIFTSLGGDSTGLFAGYFAGLAVILGHNYPIFFGFKGGKGFASGIGALIILNPIFTVITSIVGIVLLLIVDRMAVFALSFFLAQAIYHIIIYGYEFWWISLITILYFLLAIIAHWGNIIRLIHGEEKPLNLMDKIKNKKD